jgi:hypothetical protein
LEAKSVAETGVASQGKMPQATYLNVIRLAQIQGDSIRVLAIVSSWGAGAELLFHGGVSIREEITDKLLIVLTNALIRAAQDTIVISQCFSSTRQHCMPACTYRPGSSLAISSQSLPCCSWACSRTRSSEACQGPVLTALTFSSVNHVTLLTSSLRLTGTKFPRFSRVWTVYPARMSHDHGPSPSILRNTHLFAD